MKVDRNVTLFIDSGGFTLLGENISLDPIEILRFQEKNGANIVSTLDYSISPEMSYRKKLRESKRISATLLLCYLKEKRRI